VQAGAGRGRTGEQQVGLFQAGQDEQFLADRQGLVAEAVLQIARTFGLSPVAEGVEDALTATRLRELDCAQAQGYHFARPMPAGELTALLTRQDALQL
jgi:EAL domain-containing protein (putative c-di-GMP-specific phosphodiesterase class I)